MRWGYANYHEYWAIVGPRFSKAYDRWRLYGSALFGYGHGKYFPDDGFTTAGSYGKVLAGNAGLKRHHFALDALNVQYSGIFLKKATGMASVGFEVVYRL